MTRRSTFLGCLGFAVVCTCAASAGAQEGSSYDRFAPDGVPWEVRLGYRGSFVEGSGYAPFSSNDYLSQLNLSASRLVFTRGRFSLTAGVAWDYGEASAAARGSDSSLTLHRLTVPLAAHYSVLRWLDVIATVAPGAQYEGASLQEASALAPLAASSWVPCADASLGVAWGFARGVVGRVPLLFRLTAEGGYGWTGPMSLSMTPELAKGSPQLVGATDLGTLAMSGGFGRVGVAVAF